MSEYNDAQNQFNSNYPQTPPQAPQMGGHAPQTQEKVCASVPQAPSQQPSAPVYAPPQPPIHSYAPPQAPRVQYTPPVHPETPPYVPPQAPSVNQVYGAVNQPYPSGQPAGGYGYIPPQPPRQPQPFNGGYNGYQAVQPPKQPMSGGLKALIIIVLSFLVVTLFGFIAYVAFNNNSNNNFNNTPSMLLPTEPRTRPNTDYTNPYSFFGGEDETVATVPSEDSYKQSDAKDKIDKNFEGLKLNKKPSKAEKSGSGYAFSSVEKSVVGIICYKDGQEGTSSDYSVMGSGMIITENGYVVTNAHIISNSRTAYKIKVIAGNGKEYKAGVVGFDSRSDIAVLKIDAKGLSPVTFGDSADIEITEDVIVVGNPLSLNYQNSVTKGIISAVNRRVSASNNVKYIQTDAAINPGNSGGPLCNMYGQVIGVASSKIALDDYEGMCFAIPSATVKKVADDIIRYSYVQNRVKIGITGKVNYINSEIGTAIQIIEITPDGPMDGTKAQAGDCVVEVDGEKVRNFAEIYELLENYKAGDKVKVKIYRASENKYYTFKITLKADEN